MNTSEVRPFFIPEHIDYASLPESLRMALAAIVEPLYETCVMEVKDPMERSLGLSLVSCQIIEIIEQFRLGAEAGLTHRFCFASPEFVAFSVLRDVSMWLGCCDGSLWRWWRGRPWMATRGDLSRV